MTSDKIIAMAKEAGFFVSGGWVYSSAGKGHHINESLSRFRDLVLEEAWAVCQRKKFDVDPVVHDIADAILDLKEPK